MAICGFRSGELKITYVIKDTKDIHTFINVKTHDKQTKNSSYFHFSFIGFTGNVVAVMHGANAPLMKVYPAQKHLFWHEAVNYKYNFQIMCPKKV